MMDRTDEDRAGMTPDASLPPAERPTPPLTEEELAHLDQMVERFPDHHILPVAVSRMRRLIADLRASRAELAVQRQDAREDYARAEEAEQEVARLKATLRAKDEEVKRLRLLQAEPDCDNCNAAIVARFQDQGLSAPTLT